jgi:hypothetical protein
MLILLNIKCLFSVGNMPKGRLTRSMKSSGRGERRSRNLFGEPQFICGVRAAAPGAGVPFLKSRLRLFKQRAVI